MALTEATRIWVKNNFPPEVGTEIYDNLNLVDTISTAEIGVIDGVTAGTAAASKAVVLDASKGIATITSATITTLTSTTIVVGTASLVEADLLLIDAITAGTIAASKAVTVDANKDAGDFRNLDCVNLDAGSSGAAGTVDVFPTTALKGKLALTCADQTGNTTVTVNANAMGQATQVNIADPGAAASYVVQSTAAVTLAEADVLDGATAGTAVASKAVVLDASKNHAGISILTLGTIGVGGVVGQLKLSDGANPGYKAIVQTDAQTADLTVHYPDPGAIVDAYVALSTAALTAAEVDVLDGVTAGTAAASKAVVLDGSKGIATITSATITTLTSTTIVVGTASLVEADLLFIDAVTAGTAAANKAVVLDASKGIATITSATITTLTSTTVNATNIDAGASGAAGTVDVFPTTAAKGKLILSCTDNTTDHTVTITNGAANGANVTITVPALTGYAALSTAALTLAETDVLDGATAGTAVANKAVVLDGSKGIATITSATITTLTVETISVAAEAAEHGAGAIGTGVAPATHRYTVNGEIITDIKVDLQGLASVVTANDVIGLAAGGNAYIGRNVVATNGVIFKIELICLETPAGGDIDVNVVANVSGVLAYDGAGGVAYGVNGGNAAAGQVVENLVQGLTANDYFYLTAGTGSAATYTAGQFIVRLHGHPVLT